MPQTGSRHDPFAAFNFLIEIDGVTVGGFSECSGLTTESDHIDYRTGAEDITVRKLPGLRKYPNIVLKRGFTNSKELWEWRKKVINGKTERCPGSVRLLDEARQPALTWNFREGWPCKWEGPALNGSTNAVAVETLEICHEGLELT